MSSSQSTANQGRMSVYVVDDDHDVRENLVDLLTVQYEDVQAFDSPVIALNKIKTDAPIVVLTDLRMPAGDGLEFAKAVFEIDRDIPVILMSGYGDISIAVEAMKHGIYDFIEKPVDIERLLKSLERAIQQRKLSLALQSTRQRLAQYDSIDAKIIGHSPVIRQLRKDVLKLAPMDIPVLIYGETGSGKELVARCLHEFSSRNKNAFVALNCAAIPDHLAEAELFGHEKGAFTDAGTAREGKILHASGGTLFLDEIESLSPAVQAKLLRVLQDGILTPLGSNKEIKTDCRILSASKESLRDHENFRQDLYFRLQVGELQLPGLSDRNEDILLLFEYFTRQNCENLSLDYSPPSKQTEEFLLSYSWPGNVRELVNVATRYVINGCRDVKEMLGTRDDHCFDVTGRSLKQQVCDFEAKLIQLKLARYQGNVAEVLKDLQLERRTFNQKIARYQITTSDYRNKN